MFLKKLGLAFGVACMLSSGAFAIQTITEGCPPPGWKPVARSTIRPISCVVKDNSVEFTCRVSEGSSGGHNSDYGGSGSSGNDYKGTKLYGGPVKSCILRAGLDFKVTVLDVSKANAPSSAARRIRK
jgi:hypothetical protein